MVEPPSRDDELPPEGAPSAGAPEGIAQRARRNYALAAAEALVQYLASGFRFGIRTVDAGERVEPAREGKRVIFTLPDWDAYSALLRSHLNSWWLRTRGS
jgi:hypothetical protein